MSHAGYHTDLDHTCTYCELRYPKYFHPHAWRDLRKLDSKKMIGDKIYYRDAQEEICKKYNVFVPLYRTKRERRIDSIKRVWWTTRRILKAIKKLLDEQHEKNQKRKSVQKRKQPSIFKALTMTEKDYRSITGKSTNADLSFITGRGKKDYSALTNKRNSYSALTGNNKRNYSGLIGSKKKIRL